jgi:hypothetical protein
MDRPQQDLIEAAQLVCQSTAWKAATYPRHVEVQTEQWDAAVKVCQDWLRQNGFPVPERE